MQYRTDPKSGKQLSALGFGCMRFPRALNAALTDRAKTEKLVLSAIERGVNYFDTAYVYPGSEAVLGDILDKNNVREKIILATKLPYTQCRKYGDFDMFFNEQLKRLKTDRIDFYLIHNVSSVKAWDELRSFGVERWIAEKKSAGLIGRAGFSFHGAQKEFLSLLDAYDWDFCQIQYNYMNENYQAGRAGLLKAHEKGLPVIVMEPLLGGKLANGLPKDAVRILNADSGGLSAAALALRWLWNRPEVTVVLSGMSGMPQLDENIKIAETAFAGAAGEHEAALCRRVASILEEAYKIPCTGCDYCMPCPSGVNIPACFSAYNTSFALGFVTGITQYATSAGSTDPTKAAGARKCEKCGQCEKKCPQNIDIMSRLETVTKRMEPFWFGPVMKIISGARKKGRNGEDAPA